MLHLPPKYRQFAARTDPGFCSQDMPSPFKDLSGSIFCFIQIAPFTSSRTHFSFSRSSDFTLWLWLHTFWKSVSPASLSDPTVIGTFAIVLFAVITECRLQIQLALLKPLPNFFTPILFCSHAFQFVHNLEKILETIRSLSCGIVLTSIERHTS